MAGASATGSRRRHSSSLPLPKPLRWYVDWVRNNEDNVQSLERLSRTFAMICSNPANLINMEGCWTVSKLHTLVNQTIVQTSHHAVTTSEVLTYILKAIQELEGLGELLLRKWCRQGTTWNVLLALQAVKCVLNACVHQQLFLMPWVWHSVRMYLRSILRLLWIPRYLLTDKHKRTAMANGSAVDTLTAASGGNKVLNNVHGQTIGPTGARLVIPRVVSNRRSEHRHYFNPSRANGGGAGVSEETKEEKEVAEEKESAEAVPFTFLDILGVLVDAYLLIRPTLVLATARHAFPKTGGEDIARLPGPPSAGEVKASATTATDDADAVKAPLTKAEKETAAEEAALDNFRVLRIAMQASTAQRTLFASWRWWGLFAAVDAVVVLVSRFIRSHRIPVVYISEPSAAEALRTESSHSGATSGAEEVGGEEDGAVRTGDDGSASSGAGREHGEAATATATASAVPTGGVAVSSEPAVISRDGLRLQQAMRNMGLTFLRDPFFTVVLKQFLYDHLVNGFVNKIPLLGSLVAFQMSYLLSMQHFSFLYSLGQ